MSRRVLWVVAGFWWLAVLVLLLATSCTAENPLFEGSGGGDELPDLTRRPDMALVFEGPPDLVVTGEDGLPGDPDLAVEVFDLGRPADLAPAHDLVAPVDIAAWWCPRVACQQQIAPGVCQCCWGEWRGGFVGCYCDPGKGCSPCPCRGYDGGP